MFQGHFHSATNFRIHFGYFFVAPLLIHDEANVFLFARNCFGFLWPLGMSGSFMTGKSFFMKPVMLSEHVKNFCCRVFISFLFIFFFF